MKLLMVLPETERYSPVRGGAIAVWTDGIARHLNGRRLSVLCRPDRAEYASADIVHVPSRTGYVLRRAALETARHRRPRRALSIGRLSDYTDQLAAHVRAGEYDVLHIHNRPEFIPILREAAPGSKLFLHLNNDHLLEWGLEDRTALLGECDQVLFCSRFLLQNALRGLETTVADRCVVLPNGVDCDRFDPSAEFPPSIERPRTPYILFVGRLTPEKGAHLLIEAFTDVLRIMPECKLLVAGGDWFGSHRETQYMRSLRRMTLGLGEAVAFVGPVPHTQLPGLYAGAAVFVCPSVWPEPFGMVIAEAMASGTPVVASNRGGIPEVLGDCGRLFDPGAPHELQATITEVFQDPNETMARAVCGLRRVRRLFRWEAIAEQYRELLNTTGPGSVSGRA